MLRGLMSDVAGSDSTAAVGQFRCMVTDDPDRFARLAPRFLGRTIAPPQLVSTDDLFAQTTGSGAVVMESPSTRRAAV
jgi:hypothetical protein